MQTQIYEQSAPTRGTSERVLMGIQILQVRIPVHFSPDVDSDERN